MHGYEKVFGEGGNPVIGMSIMDLKSFFSGSRGIGYIYLRVKIKKYMEPHGDHMIYLLAWI